jgi:hypothetical protein
LNITLLPFNKLIGLEPAGPDCMVGLPEGPQYLNHLGTVHASALLAVAEAGSGEFLVGMAGIKRRPVGKANPTAVLLRYNEIIGAGQAPRKTIMKKILVISIVLVMGLSYWAYRGAQTWQAYRLAVAELSDRSEISRALGAYELRYDWWFGVFRALRYREIQEFEFHIDGRRDDAIAVVNLERSGAWKVICVNVVNGEYLNNRIIQDC